MLFQRRNFVFFFCVKFGPPSGNIENACPALDNSGSVNLMSCPLYPRSQLAPREGKDLSMSDTPDDDAGSLYCVYSFPENFRFEMNRLAASIGSIQ